MGKTAIYEFPWPELPDPGNGPDGYVNLAERIDARMTRYRSELNLGSFDAGWAFNPGTTSDFWYTSVDVNKGWIEFDTHLVWYSQGSCAAGIVNVLIDGAMARSWEFHNDCKGTSIYNITSGSVAQEFVSGKKGVDMRININVNPLGSPILFTTCNVVLRQFGAG